MQDLMSILVQSCLNFHNLIESVATEKFIKRKLNENLKSICSSQSIQT